MYLYGIAGLAFLALSILLGWAVLKRLNIPLRDIELAVLSPVPGILISSWLCFVVSFISDSLLTGILACTAVMLIAIYLLKPWKLGSRLDDRHLPALVLIVLVSFQFMFLGLLNYHNGEYHVAYPLFGDAAFHTSIITSFSSGDNFPPEYPMMAGQPLRYTFLMDFHSAILDYLGMGIQWSVVLPGIVLLSSILSLIYFAAIRFTDRTEGGVFAVLLIIFSGGLGFISAIEDWQISGMPLDVFLLSQNLNYTCNYELGYVFTNFIIIVMAQRNALIGFAAGAAIVLMLYAIMVNREGADHRGVLLITGIIAGLMPMFHMYSYISIMLAVTLLIVLYREKNWYLFLIPAVLLAIPQYLWVSAQVGESFIKLHLWWMAGDITNVPGFWVKNMGFELVLLLAGLILAGKEKLKFYIPFAAIFIMANLMLFQPWDYDNHKFFSFWLMPSVLFMAAALLYIYDLPKIGKPLFSAFMALAMFTGSLVAVFLLVQPYTIFTGDGEYVSDWIKENTPRDAVFLTSESHVHPVVTLAGRKSYLGYAGWLYTHGLSYDDRAYNTSFMYGASLPEYEEAITLLKSNNIDYVIIGPDERQSCAYYINRDFFDCHFEVVFNWTSPEYHNNYKIYKVK